MSREIIKSVLGWLPFEGLDVDGLTERYLVDHPEHRGEMTKHERLVAFVNSVSLLEGVPADVKQEFIDYWTEANQKSLKFRWEKEKTWELPKRMKRFWKNKVTCFDKYPERWDGNGPVSQVVVKQGVLEVNANRSWNKG